MNVPACVTSILDLIGLNTFLPLYSSLDEALSETDPDKRAVIEAVRVGF